MTFDKKHAFFEGVDLCRKFCEANAIDDPTYKISERIGDYGQYGQGTIVVNVNRCRPPSVSNYSWSWPGYSADLTPLGVVTHELGHHWHFWYGVRDITRDWKDTIKGQREKPVSSYGASCTHEDIAEAFKLFVNNPTLLQELWPVRYELFRSYLEPVVTTHWRAILADSPRHIKVVERKLSMKA